VPYLGRSNPVCHMTCTAWAQARSPGGHVRLRRMRKIPNSWNGFRIPRMALARAEVTLVLLQLRVRRGEREAHRPRRLAYPRCAPARPPARPPASLLRADCSQERRPLAPTDRGCLRQNARAMPTPVTGLSVCFCARLHLTPGQPLPIMATHLWVITHFWVL
jgi:hypothetical protein